MAKLTAKQEAFCQAVMTSESQVAAYREVYDVSETAKDEGVWVDSCKVMGNPKVALRVLELRELATERCLVTVESLTAELEEARAMAVSEKQAAAMTGASMGKAKLHGLDVTKVDGTFNFKVDIPIDDKDL